MGWKSVPGLLAVLVCAVVAGSGVAKASCTLPNTLTNGQLADATQVMANFNTAIDCAEDPGPRPHVEP